MTWPSFLQFLIAVVLGAWLKGGRSAIPGNQVFEKLADAIGKRIKGKNGLREVPNLPDTGP